MCTPRRNDQKQISNATIHWRCDTAPSIGVNAAEMPTIPMAKDQTVSIQPLAPVARCTAQANDMAIARPNAEIAIRPGSITAPIGALGHTSPASLRKKSYDQTER